MPVVFFGLDPVFVAGGVFTITGVLWRGVRNSMFGASLVFLRFFGLNSDASESFGGLLNSSPGEGDGGTLLSVLTSMVMLAIGSDTDVAWE